MALVTADAAVQDKKEATAETKQIEQAESQKTEKRGLHHSIGDFGGHDFGGHDFGGHDFGGDDHGHHHHHEHVKTITIEKKVPVPYTVHKHVPYTVEKKVPYTVHVPVPQVKMKNRKVVTSEVLIELRP